MVKTIDLETIVPAGATRVLGIEGETTGNFTLPGLSGQMAGMVSLAAYLPSGFANGADITTYLATARATGRAVYLPEAPGGHWYLPAGLTLADDDHIYGDPNGRTIIKTDGRTAVTGLNVNRWLLKDLTFDLNKAVATDDGTPTTTQIGVYVRATSATGSSGTLDNVRVQNAHGVASRLSASHSAGTPYPLDVTLRDCSAYNCYFATYILNPTRVHIDHFWDGEGCDFGIEVVGDTTGPFDNDTTIVNCAMKGVTGHGIVVKDDHRNLTIANNIVTDCATGSADWGICVSVACSQFACFGNVSDGNGGGITIDVRRVAVFTALAARGGVVGNVCTNSTRATSGHGINVNYAEGLAIVGNACHGNAGDGIAVSGLRAVVTGNSCTNNTRYGLTLNLDASYASEFGGNEIGVNQLRNNGLGDFQDLTTDSYSTWCVAQRLGAGGPIIAWGTGSPEGVVTGNVGSTFHRTDGGAGTSQYFKESGTGNTGWVGK